jgi:hypothetical protein
MQSYLTIPSRATLHRLIRKNQVLTQTLQPVPLPGYRKQSGVTSAMTIFGPVAEAAQGGHSSPSFDLLVGFAVLGLTWISYFRIDSSKKMTIWIAIGISAICGVFIYSGLAALIR